MVSCIITHVLWIFSGIEVLACQKYFPYPIFRTFPIKLYFPGLLKCLKSWHATKNEMALHVYLKQTSYMYDWPLKWRIMYQAFLLPVVRPFSRTKKSHCLNFLRRSLRTPSGRPVKSLQIMHISFQSESRTRPRQYVYPFLSTNFGTHSNFLSIARSDRRSSTAAQVRRYMVKLMHFPYLNNCYCSNTVQFPSPIGQRLARSHK